MMELDSGAVVGEARAGNVEAFRILVENHSREVFRLAFRITRNEQDAEDAVQETFLKAYQKLDTFDGRSAFRTWLYRVAANTALDVLRRRRRNERRSTSLDAERDLDRGPSSQDPAPDRLVYSHQLKQRIQAAIDDLSPLERAAFVLRHFENSSLADIGQSLGLREGAIKQAVFRAVRKIRKALEPAMRTAP